MVRLGAVISGRKPPHWERGTGQCFIDLICPDTARLKGVRSRSPHPDASFQVASACAKEGLPAVATGMLVTLGRTSFQTAAWQGGALCWAHGGPLITVLSSRGMRGLLLSAREQGAVCWAEVSRGWGASLSVGAQPWPTYPCAPFGSQAADWL